MALCVLLWSFFLWSCLPSDDSKAKSLFGISADSISVLKNSAGNTLIVRIVGTSEHHGRQFSMVEQIYRGETGWQGIEPREYWVDDSGSVYRHVVGCDSLVRYNINTLKRKRIPNDGISLWYNMNAQPGQAWTAWANVESPLWLSRIGKLTIDEYRIIMETNEDTVRIGATLLSGCVRFRIEDLYASSSTYYDWIAYGYGLVRRKWAHSPDSLAYTFIERIPSTDLVDEWVGGNR